MLASTRDVDKYTKHYSFNFYDSTEHPILSKAGLIFDRMSNWDVFSYPNTLAESKHNTVRAAMRRAIKTRAE